MRLIGRLKKRAYSCQRLTDIPPIEKWEFYEAVASPEHVLTIQTGDQALWANLLVTVGVIEA